MIIDTNNDTTRKLAQLKADGVETIIRYLSTNMSGQKAVKEPEARAIAAAGLKLGLVFEIWGGVNNFEHADINRISGISHGTFSKEYAPAVGAPDGTIIWFAIDTDVIGSQYDALVRPYLTSIKQALGGKFRLGVYACGYVCSRALADGIVDATWLTQSMGWNGSRAFRDSNKWNLLQGAETTLHGLSVDTNTARADYGAFVPFSGVVAPPPLPVHDIVWMQNTLNKLGADPQLMIDGKVGPATLNAIIKNLERELEAIS